MIKRINQWLVIRQAQITFKPDNIDRLFVAVEHGDKGLKMDESVYTLLLVSWIASLVIFVQLLFESKKQKELLQLFKKHSSIMTCS
jgi:hypothetical protein